MTAPLWQYQSFAELDNHDLYQLLRARQAVFVLEQQCLYQDLDDADQDCKHLCVWQQNSASNLTSNSDKQLLAYLRVAPPGLKYSEVAIGRVLTTAAARGQGLGKRLMLTAIAHCHSDFPGHNIRIGAQHYLLNFYTELGFELASDIYDEDGIAHVEMLLVAKTPS